MPPLFETYQDKARRIVLEWYNTQEAETEPFKDESGKVTMDLPDSVYQLVLADIYVVWFSKTLQNWKALVSTGIPDGRYYEVTYDGDKKQAYLDVYEKLHNVAIPDGT